MFKYSLVVLILLVAALSPTNATADGPTITAAKNKPIEDIIAHPNPDNPTCPVCIIQMEVSQNPFSYQSGEPVQSTYVHEDAVRTRD